MTEDKLKIKSSDEFYDVAKLFAHECVDQYEPVDLFGIPLDGWPDIYRLFRHENNEEPRSLSQLYEFWRHFPKSTPKECSSISCKLLECDDYNIDRLNKMLLSFFNGHPGYYEQEILVRQNRHEDKKDDGFGVDELFLLARSAQLCLTVEYVEVANSWGAEVLSVGKGESRTWIAEHSKAHLLREVKDHLLGIIYYDKKDKK